MCGPKFCSMKISKEVRDFAAENNLDGDKEAIEKGMEEMSQVCGRGIGNLFLTGIKVNEHI